jgi:hypothetical protein
MLNRPESLTATRDRPAIWKRADAVIPMTPSLAKEGVSVAPAKATPMASLQELSSGRSRSSVPSTFRAVSRDVARARACPVSSKMYRSRTREAARICRPRQHYRPIYRAFVQALFRTRAGDPSLPFWGRGDWSQPTATDFA